MSIPAFFAAAVLAGMGEPEMATVMFLVAVLVWAGDKA